MKGVINGIAPQTKIIDISHDISPQNIREAALILSRSAPYFPDGTIHVVVVDPGVGTDRWPIAAQLGKHFFVGPDNGVITLLLEWAESNDFETLFVNLNKEKYWLPNVSKVFHGRDIFSPVAAHLATGVSLTELGTPFVGPVRIDFPNPKRTERGWLGEVIHIDHFGNISSNIRRHHLGESIPSVVTLCGVEIHGIVGTFGERPQGELISLFGSTDYLIVSVVNGSAAEQLGAKIGDPIEVILL